VHPSVLFQEAWNCLHNPLQRTHVTWPTQPRPGLCARKMWRQAIKLAFPWDRNHGIINPVDSWMLWATSDIHICFFHPPASSVYATMTGKFQMIGTLGTRGEMSNKACLWNHNHALSLPPRCVQICTETNSWADYIVLANQPSTLSDSRANSVQTTSCNGGANGWVFLDLQKNLDLQT
jgi:hypothetical protein